LVAPLVRNRTRAFGRNAEERRSPQAYRLICRLLGNGGLGISDNGNPEAGSHVQQKGWHTPVHRSQRSGFRGFHRLLVLMIESALDY